MTAGRPHTRDFGYMVATVVSYVINPLILPPILFACVLFLFGASSGEIWQTFGIASLFFCIIPLIYLVIAVFRGEIETLEVRTRERRFRPLMVGIVAYAIGVLILFLTVDTARSLITLLAVIYPLNGVFLMLITMKWKISVHMSGFAAFVAVLFYLYTMGKLVPTSVLFVLIALIPILMWARVRSGAHTFAETVGGTLFGLCMVWLQLSLFFRVVGSM